MLEKIWSDAVLTEAIIWCQLWCRSKLTDDIHTWRSRGADAWETCKGKNNFVLTPTLLSPAHSIRHPGHADDMTSLMHKKLEHKWIGANQVTGLVPCQAAAKWCQAGVRLHCPLFWFDSARKACLHKQKQRVWQGQASMSWEAKIEETTFLEQKRLFRCFDKGLKPEFWIPGVLNSYEL